MRAMMGLLFAVVIAAAAVPAQAIPADGVFTAAQACPASRAIAGANPGNVTTEPGRTYEVREINKANGDFWRILVPGAPEPRLRWVARRCGTHAAAGAAPAATTPRPAATTTRQSAENVLAVTWLPAFCEGQPGARDCRALAEGRFADANGRFSLHGLWPESGCWCGAAGKARSCFGDDRGARILAPSLSRATAARLAPLMPGTLAGLDDHEWSKHGTCYLAPGGAETYFADAIRLVEALNASPVGGFFKSRIGRTVTLDEITAAFARAFGPGAGERVAVTCQRDRGVTLMRELRIELKGLVAPGVSLGDLILAADPLPRRERLARNCDGKRTFTIDPAGLQD